MTLGGLALAVGILVDDVTVAIENTYRLFEEGKPRNSRIVRPVSAAAMTASCQTPSIAFETKTDWSKRSRSA
jgi:multidrug efflux pump subunit AcrB